jgi:hypothetical protein
VTRRLAALVLLAAGAARSGESASLAGEIFAGGVFEQFHGVQIRALDLRLGLGGRQSGVTVLGLELGVLFTAGGQLGSTVEGLSVKEGRLGAGIRGRNGRLTLGLDAEGVLLSITRKSMPGSLVGTGFAARALIALDLVQFGNSAIYAGVEGSLSAIGSSDDRYLPAALFGLGFRM